KDLPSPCIAGGLFLLSHNQNRPERQSSVFPACFSEIFCNIIWMKKYKVRDIISVIYNSYFC
ncbi:hypothetical protein, partial [Ruminococcus sp. AF17-12]|uniref:hypothetical protein n=1 Tax=Ruminococcus sp. AF17-12 TaxID=2293151 RepID=UPI001A9B6E62